MPFLIAGNSDDRFRIGLTFWKKAGIGPFAHLMIAIAVVFYYRECGSTLLSKRLISWSDTASEICENQRLESANMPRLTSGIATDHWSGGWEAEFEQSKSWLCISLHVNTLPVWQNQWGYDVFNRPCIGSGSSTSCHPLKFASLIVLMSFACRTGNMCRRPPIWSILKLCSWPKSKTSSVVQITSLGWMFHQVRGTLSNVALVMCPMNHVAGTCTFLFFSVQHIGQVMQVVNRKPQGLAKGFQRRSLECVNVKQEQL